MNNMLIIIFIMITLSVKSLFSLNPEWIVYNTSNSILANNRITALALDSLGNKWVGTYWGITKIKDNIWTVYGKVNSVLLDEVVTSIAAKKSDNIWVGTKSGYTMFNGTIWICDTIKIADIKYVPIYSIAIDDSNNIWVGSQRFELFKFNGTEWSKHKNNYFLNPMVMSIAIDSLGNKWVGTGDEIEENGLGLLAKFDGNSWTTYNNLIDCLPAFNISSIAIDKHQTKWLGGMYGFVRYDDSTCKSFTTSNSYLPNNKIRSIVIDNEGNKWLGTDGGLAKFDDSTWTVWNTSNSDLPSNIITCIVIDKYDNKWLGTEGGGLAVFREGGVVGVEDVPKVEVSNISCAPNPAQEMARINYQIPSSSHVIIKVFDILGNTIAVPVDEFKEAGAYSVNFDVSNLPPGLYFYRLQTRNEFKMCKMLVIR